MLEVNECLLQWKNSSENILCTAADHPNQTWWMAAWTRRENQFEDEMKCERLVEYFVTFTET